MLDIASLRPGSADEQSWRIAKRVAREILAGRSTDITGGAKFYHTTGVSPAWSRGLEPDQVIGNHLFFRSVHGSA
jgi:spore germination cell wall hydrolase CwlJ-like protein